MGRSLIHIKKEFVWNKSNVIYVTSIYPCCCILMFY